MKDNVYKKSFDLFLKNTDEKKIILNFIKKNIKLNKKTNFLDIGGGNGSLAYSISKKVNKTVVIEPNIYFYNKIKKDKNLNVTCDKWENVELKNKFNFILAAYVITYFKKTKIKKLIKKMYDYLEPGGKIIILSVDSKKGSWREIHSFFYKLIGLNHDSSDNELRKIISEYNVKPKIFKTYVIAKDSEEMLKILKFDFNKYKKYFSKFNNQLKNKLNDYCINKKNIVLEVFHNSYIITKK